VDVRGTFGRSCEFHYIQLPDGRFEGRHNLNPQLSDRHAFYSPLGNASRNHAARVTVR
jgi:hypothetical protein